MQTDLFDVPSQQGVYDKQGSFKSLEDYRISLRLDQCLILMIVLLVGFALVFTAGVQKGKQSAPVEIKQETARSRTMPEIPSAAILGDKQVTSSLITENAKAGTSAVPSNSNHAIPALLSEAAVTAQEAPRVVVVEPGSEAPAAAKKALEGAFTVQMVTYKTEREAQAQIERLKKNGYEGFVIPSGSYQQVCINAFQTKTEARQFMTDLKSQGMIPGDAYVRSIPH